MRRVLGWWVAAALLGGVLAAGAGASDSTATDVAAGGPSAGRAATSTSVSRSTSVSAATSTTDAPVPSTTTTPPAPPAAPTTDLTTNHRPDAPPSTAPGTTAPPSTPSTPPDGPAPMRDLAIDEWWDATLSGTVSDQAGRPVGGACVDLVTNWADQPVVRVRTDATGRYALTWQEWVVRNTPHLTVRDCSGAVPGFGLVELQPVVDIDVPETLDVVVGGAGAAVFGIATDAAGRPLAGACVVLFMWPMSPQYARAGADGWWLVAGLPPDVPSGFWVEATDAGGCDEKGLSGNRLTPTHTDRAVLTAGEVRGPVALVAGG